VLRLGGRETTWNIAETVPLGNSLIIRFAGIESPEAARQLQGAEIIAPRAGAAPLKEGEYYVEDLKGLEVVNSEGCPLGCVTGVVEGGGASLAEVQLLSGESRLVPFRNEFFGDVDFTDRRITLLESWILE
jgi:16S rRNA processing protein RimM